ncbi:MAG: Maf family protein [Anaerolineae bacterium]|jgi:MAF protein
MNPARPCLILASGSPRRRELIQLLGLPTRAISAPIEEDADPAEPPTELVVRLARAKARAVVDAYPHTPILGCDTAVSLQGRALGKPADSREAHAMLTHLRGRSHTVYTGVVLLRAGEEVPQVAETVVKMRRFSDEELSGYVASGDPLDKAGAYAIQHPAFDPVASWRGCYTNVVGLPLCHVVRALRAWDVLPPVDVPAACQAHTGQRCHVFPEILKTAVSS